MTKILNVSNPVAGELRIWNLIEWRRDLLAIGQEVQAADVGGEINARLGLNGETND